MNALTFSLALLLFVIALAVVALFVIECLGPDVPTCCAFDGCSNGAGSWSLRIYDYDQLEPTPPFLVESLPPIKVPVCREHRVMLGLETVPLNVTFTAQYGLKDLRVRSIRLDALSPRADG